MTGRLRVVRHPDARAFLGDAESWLMEREDEHNLLLGIAASLLESRAGFGAPIYLATVEADGAVAGCAFRTPPFKLGLTRLPPGGAEALAEDVAGLYSALPAVLGPNDEALAFGRAWADGHGLEAVPGTLQRIYSLDEVIMPSSLARGFMRPAVEEDLGFVTDWVRGFLDETAMRDHDPGAVAKQLVDNASLAIWENGGPVGMAGFTGRTPGTVRVSYVYTPPESRGHGYASALVAHLSRHLLGSGFRRCVLYTDLSNPTSNAIYQRLGYAPVQDVMDVEFRRSDEPGGRHGQE